MRQMTRPDNSRPEELRPRAHRGATDLRRLVGIAAGLAAVCIWAGWIVWTDLRISASAAQSFTAYDIALMRFGPPMILLSPFWLKPAFASEMRDTPWLTRAAACLKPPKTDWRLVALMFGWGAPFVLVSGAGLSGASAPLMAALVPGATPLYAALIAFVFFAARPAANARLGLVLIAIAAILGLIAAPAEERASAPWFMAAALGWAGYIVAFPRSGLSSPQAVGLLSVWSVIFLVLSAPFFPTNLMHADATAIISDVLFHGVIAGVISLLAYTIALDRAPPLIAVSLPAMVPVLAATMSAAMGAPPNWGQAAGLALASIGLATIAIASVKARKSGD